MIFRYITTFLFILSFPNFILAGEGELKGLVEENFGERYYGVYVEDYKLGYVANKLSQNKDEVVADFSMNLRLPAGLAKAEFEGAKHTLSQTISQHKFDKKTGLLSQQSETHGEKFYVDYNDLLEDRSFKEKIWIRNAKYKGDYIYEVVDTSGDETKVSSYKLPRVNMVDHFAEINFVHSNPKVGDVRKIEVSGLDFKSGIFLSLILTLEQKFKLDTFNEEYHYLVKLELDNGDVSRLKVDQYGNLIEGDLLGLRVVREPKDQALTVDAKDI